eukprot:738689-Rhodomonas_salina.2
MCIRDSLRTVVAASCSAKEINPNGSDRAGIEIGRLELMLHHAPDSAWPAAGHLECDCHENVLNFEVPAHGLNVLQLLCHAAGAIEDLEAHDQLEPVRKATRGEQRRQPRLNRGPQPLGDGAEALQYRLPCSRGSSVKDCRNLCNPGALANRSPELRILKHRLPEAPEVVDSCS